MRIRGEDIAHGAVDDASVAGVNHASFNEEMGPVVWPGDLQVEVYLFRTRHVAPSLLPLPHWIKKARRPKERLWGSTRCVPNSRACRGSLWTVHCVY